MALNFFPLNFLVSISISIFGFTLSEAQMVPAMYIFGDSLVDVGNNNYLKLSINKADFPPFGIDFPNKTPTGRFSNGKNAADFLAEKVGLPTPPPFLSLKPSKDPAAFLTGVNFASAGAGVFDGSDNRHVLPLTVQVDDFSEVYEELKKRLGSSSAQELLSKSLFTVVIGSNDITNYYDSSDLRKKSTPPEYVASMVLKLNEQLKRLYSKDARKFVMVGLPAIGCTPSIRKDIEREECSAEVNEWSTSYNQALTSMLKELASETQAIKICGGQNCLLRAWPPSRYDSLPATVGPVLQQKQPSLLGWTPSYRSLCSRHYRYYVPPFFPVHISHERGAPRCRFTIAMETQPLCLTPPPDWKTIPKLL